MPGTDRRHSTSSEDANAPPNRQLSQDGTEIIPTRMLKVTAPKPATNPLQFIKTGPCDLYKAAQEQIKKVEEIKKVEKVKDDSQDWQSNLDNWKCSRRKRQEHIIERVVEVKKLELEEHDRNRRRSKTFSEMMEERSSKSGGLRKMSILSYSEDDPNDLSDLGIFTNKEKSNGEDSTSENQTQNISDANRETQPKLEEETSNGHNTHKGSNDEESSTPRTISSPEPEEYTYERAIQGYMNFAETKIKTPIKTATERKSLNGTEKVPSPKKEPSGKIGEKLSELEQIRLRSKSTNDINGGADAKQLPKVDIHKRRSLFENAGPAETVKSTDRFPREFSNSKSIKERLSNLEKSSENSPKVNRLSGEVAPHIKETISNLERQKIGESPPERRLSNDDSSPQISIKERLNILEKQNEVEVPKVKTPTEEIRPVSIKERMSSFDAAANKDSTPKLTPERDVTFKGKLETFKLTEKNQNEPVNSFTGNSLSSCSDSQPNFHRSLDRVETEDEKKEEHGKTAVKEKAEEETAVASKQVEAAPEVELDEVSMSVSDPNKEPVVDLSNFDGSGDGKEVSCKETERDDTVGEEQKNTNQVEGNKQIEKNSEERDAHLSETECDISETIKISLPNSSSSSSCPRLNISVLVDSISGESPKTEEEEDEAQDEFPDDFQPSINYDKPKTRVRKLTPMVSTISPLKTVCELQIIEETESGEPRVEDKPEETAEVKEDAKDGDKHIAVQMNSKKEYQSGKEVQELVKTMKEMPEEFPEDLLEESSVYTDENIDEVLEKEDEEEEEIETSVDEELRYEIVTEEAKIQKELEAFTPKETPEVVSVHTLSLNQQITDKPLPVSSNYENVFISNQIPQLCMSPDSDIYASLSFGLGSRPAVEPPKEKPPPPPLELSDDESSKPELPPKPSLRRLDSTKRIKKEIRKKRKDFLGIEGSNDDSYLEPEIYVAPPPDMMTFLQEERRLEQQLYRQSICSESDSNHETAESRDSGVELDRGHVDDICWSKPDVLSEPHSRQNSETFGNTSITSDEDEIMKKEREIIEVLEKEEQWRYGNKNSNNGEQNDIGEKLAVKLRQLEQEKMQLERERAEEETARRQNEQRLITKQQQLREQENSTSHSNTDSSNEQEALRFERERLQKEQQHLERCRQNLLKQQQQQQQNPDPIEIHHRGNVCHWDTPSNRHSLQEVPIGIPMQDVPRHSLQDVSQPQYQPPQMSASYRYSLPDLQQREPRSTRHPPPIPPAKPMRPLTQEQWERESSIRNSRIPSADNIPMQIEASPKLRHGSSVPAINISHGGQQLTKSSLHAICAAPRSRIISNENWMQPKRKTDAPKNNYNYQHWLIQEAEHRRILEHQQKVSQQLQPKRTLPYNGQPPPTYVGSPSSLHTVGLPVSPSHMQGNQRWISPPRSDKPLPDAVIHSLTQRVQNREGKTSPRKRMEGTNVSLSNKMPPAALESHPQITSSGQSQERMLSVSGKKKCSHCNEELGRGAAMIIESLRLFYHIDCFKCCVCHVQLGDGLMGTDVRVRNNKLHCHNCYSSDDDGDKEDETEKFTHCDVQEEEEEAAANETSQTLLSEDSVQSDDFGPSFEALIPLSLEEDEDLPGWFKEFYNAYQFNENRKFILMQKMHLQMIDFEIKKCELLKEIIGKLKD